MIDLPARQLEVFLAVAEERHFGRAGRTLGMAQSAVSQHIRRLEETLGTALLLRTSRQVEMTAAGEALRRQAPELLGRFDGVARSVRAFAAGEAGVVELGAQGAALMAIVPGVLAHLAREHPALRVVVRSLTSAEQRDGLLRGSLDLGLVRAAAPHPDLVIDRIAREQMMAVFPSGHPLATEARIELAALAGEPLVLWARQGAPEFYDALVDACRDAGFVPRVAHRVRGIGNRLSYIAAGLGVGLEAASYSVLRHDGVVFRPLNGDPIDAPMHLVRGRLPLPPAAARVATAIEQVAGGHRAPPTSTSRP